MDPENDTGILVTWLSQTIEESRRLREDLKKGHPEGTPSKEEDVTSPDPPSPPG